MRPAWLPPEVDPTRPSVARVYDFYLGGSHNFESDREFGREAMRAMAELPAMALENRAFLRRVVQHLCGRGIDQFLDLGSGIPTVGNVHEVAQAILPEATVVYVDHDPVAVVHGITLLRDNAHATSIQHDIREPERVLAAATATGLLDLARPVGILAFAVLHFIPDDDRAEDVLARYTAALTPGSFLAISQVRSEESRAHDVQRVYEKEDSPIRRIRLRTVAELQTLFAGMVLEEPGVVAVPLWRPELDGDDDAGERSARHMVIGGLGRRP